MVDESDLLDELRASVELLITSHWELAWLDLCERDITSQLFRFLADRIEPFGLDVDHEYNRRSSLVKSLPFNSGDDEGERRIYPDLIVHRRNRRENYLAVEVKKGHRNSPEDAMKIHALLAKAAFEYRVGVLLSLGMKRSTSDPPEPYVAWTPIWTVVKPGDGGRREHLFSRSALSELNTEGWARWVGRRDTNISVSKTEM